jgi:hypothetical protein
MIVGKSTAAVSGKATQLKTKLITMVDFHFLDTYYHQ